MKPGDRVQTPVWSDEWMRGDRYGAVVSLFRSRNYAKARVLLDKSGRTRTFLCGSLEVVS